MIRETAFDEVFDSQATFRALLESLSRPGQIQRLPERDYPGAPRGFCPPVLSVLKTLCDHRVSFSLGSGIRAADWVRYLEVNLATPHEGVERADYVLFSGAAYDPDFSLLDRGLPEFPESSATALLSVERLGGGADRLRSSLLRAEPQRPRDSRARSSLCRRPGPSIRRGEKPGKPPVPDWNRPFSRGP